MPRSDRRPCADAPECRQVNPNSLPVRFESGIVQKPFNSLFTENMKTLFLPVILTLAFALDVVGATPDFTIDKQLPKVGKDWIRRVDENRRQSFQWANFDHKKNIGEVLSFVVQKVPPSTKVTDTPIRQASIGTFLSNGSARPSTSRGGKPISDRVRYRIVSIDIRARDFKREIDALEFTYIYERDGDSPATMAHGYCLVAGDKLLFIQHTSPGAIGSEFALDMAGGLLSKHFELDGKPHSIGKGEIKQTYL